MFDTIVAVPQIEAGMLDLLLGRAPGKGGISMKTVGLGLLLLTLLVAALAVRSALRLRGWRQRAQTMSPRRLALAITPHFLVPLLLLVGVYQVTLLLMDRAFNLRYIGVYFVPDLLLLLALVTLPQLVIGLYMVVTALLGRSAAPPPAPTGQASAVVGSGR